MKTEKMWAVSLLILGVAAVFLMGTRILSVELPDWLSRMMGLVELAALGVFVFATVRKFFLKK